MNPGLDQYVHHDTKCPVTLRGAGLEACWCGCWEKLRAAHASRLVAERIRDGLAEVMAGTKPDDPVVLSAEMADDLLDQLNDALAGQWREPTPTPVRSANSTVSMETFFKGTQRGGRQSREKQWPWR